MKHHNACHFQQNLDEEILARSKEIPLEYETVGSVPESHLDLRSPMHSTVINVCDLKHSWVQLYADVSLLCYAIYHTNISQQSKIFKKYPQMCVL